MSCLKNAVFSFSALLRIACHKKQEILLTNPDNQKVPTRHLSWLIFPSTVVSVLLLCLSFVVIPDVFAGAKIQNGKMEIQAEPTPCRVITMNQASTEIMLALGLDEKLAGTAYLDDVIQSDFAAAYAKVPVLSDKYPPKEVMIDVNPDFVYAGYISAFSTKRGLFDRNQLQNMGIRSYVSPSVLIGKRTHWTIAILFQELQDIGKIFNIEERANRLVISMRKDLNRIKKKSDYQRKPKILWLDRVDSKSPFIGAGYGAPDEIIRLAGGVNVFADVHGQWANVSKEQIIDLEIDLIVLIDANWEPAEKKKKLLKDDVLYQNLDAVKNNRFVQIDYSASTPGVRIPQAVMKLSQSILSLDSAKVEALK